MSGQGVEKLWLLEWFWFDRSRCREWVEVELRYLIALLRTNYDQCYRTTGYSDYAFTKCYHEVVEPSNQHNGIDVQWFGIYGWQPIRELLLLFMVSIPHPTSAAFS